MPLRGLRTGILRIRREDGFGYGTVSDLRRSWGVTPDAPRSLGKGGRLPINPKYISCVMVQGSLRPLNLGSVGVWDRRQGRFLVNLWVRVAKRHLDSSSESSRQGVAGT